MRGYRARPERVGLILVHGIGEQKRFEHLDSQGRQIIRALQLAAPGQTVEIEAPDAATFHAEQATWSTGDKGSVRIVVASGGKVTHHIHLHEVWWEDVNERSSIMKQLRFWWWGLAVWLYPGSNGGKERQLAGTDAMQSPPMSQRHRWWGTVWHRARLFAVGSVFTIGALPFGIGFPLLQRLFGLRRITPLQTIANYMSAVKLFNQPHRYGPEIRIPGTNADFLDAMGDPPRVSVRRRMMRAIADAALAPYDRWYIVAHSQGTIAAFNGLMELADTWSGYFTEAQWTKMRDAGLVGPSGGPLRDGAMMMPKRPVWNTTGEIAYRARLFERFHGFVSLGSPIEKFATIWPARVPLSRTPAFRPGSFWINVFDPLDPVSGLMKSYRQPSSQERLQVCPDPFDLGYRSHWALLVAHLAYLERCGGEYLADGIATLLLTGDTTAITDCSRSFRPGTATAHARTLAVWCWWLALYALLAGAAAWALQWLISSLQTGLRKRWRIDWTWQPSFPLAVLIAVAISVVLPAGAGLLARRLGTKLHDPEAPPQGVGILSDGDPDPPLAIPWHRSTKAPFDRPEPTQASAYRHAWQAVHPTTG